VQAAFEKRETDKVPVGHISSSSQVASALLGRDAYVGGGKQQWREARAHWQGEDAHQEFLERSFQDALDLARVLENDLVRVSYWRYDRKPTKRIDDFTFLYEEGREEDWRVLRYDPESEECQILPARTASPAGSAGHPGARAQARPTLDDLARQVEAEERALAGYQPNERTFAFEVKARRLLGEEYAIRVGAVSVGIPLTDTDTWLEAMLLRRDVVERLLDLQVEHARRNVAFLAPLGFRYFFGGLDFAGNDRTMYSPRLFHELLLPRIARISEVCHRAGGYHLFASDGDLWSVADDLFGPQGVDGYYEIDRRAGMDLGRLRSRFPHLTCMGNISSHTLHRGSREEVVAEALSCLEEAKRSRGIIVGTSNAFVPGTPIDNVLALLETIREQR
jgi:hypothetical protein